MIVSEDNDSNFNFIKNTPKVKKAPDLDENRKDILKFFGID